MSKRYQGQFFAFEGPNGSGKTTVVQTVAQRLRNKLGGDQVIVLQNPSKGPIGTEIRRFLAAQRAAGVPPLFSQSDETYAFALRLALLFLADRQMQQAEIAAALAAEKTVLLDRYHLSTLIYQAAMVGDLRLQTAFAKTLDKLHHGIVLPTTTTVLCVPPSVGRARLLARGGRIDDMIMADIEPATAQMYREAKTLFSQETPSKEWPDHEPFSVGPLSIIDANRPLEIVVEDVMENMDGMPF